MKVNILLIASVIMACLSIALVKSCADAKTIQGDNDVLRSDNQLQGQVIAMQAFNFARFNQVAAETGRLNSLIGARSDKTVIEYREILRHEKTCDLPVPASVAGGLLKYANRLRASAMHPDTGGADKADDSAATARNLTYCQAVLWIQPILAVIEKGNRNLLSIWQIEGERKGSCHSAKECS